MKKRVAGFLFALALLLSAAAPPPARQTTWKLPIKNEFGGGMALSSDGGLLAWAGQEPLGPMVLHVWDTRRQQRILNIGHWASGGDNCLMDHLAFLPKAKGVVVGAGISRPDIAEKFKVIVKVIGLPVGQVITEFWLPPGRGLHGVLTPDGKTLIVSGPGIVAALHDLATGKESVILTAPDAAKTLVSKFAVSPNGKLLAVGTSGREAWVSIWDIGQRKRLWHKRTESNLGVKSLSFSPDGKFLASATGLLQVWRVSDGEPLLGKQRRGTQWTHFLSDGKTVLLGAIDNRIGFVGWDHTSDRYYGTPWRVARPRDRRGRRAWEGPPTIVNTAISANRKKMAIERDNRTFEVWDLRDPWPK